MDIQKSQLKQNCIFGTEQNTVQQCSTYQYTQYFTDLPVIDKQSQIQELHLKLKQNGFMINDKPAINNFQIQLFHKCENWQVIQVNVKIGIYQKCILVLNINSECQTHQLNIFSGGSIGNIFIYDNQTDNFAIKCMKRFDNVSDTDNLFLLGIKEYFILCIMSALEIGPKIKKFSGFDIIISNNCLQFSMEVCSPCQNKLSQIMVDLKTALRKMHMLRIIHMDIKPMNIMYSNTFKKNIFIDFGLSDIICQNIGFKTLSSFKGTAGYCGKQMLKCLKNKNYVNLYEHDIICLKNSSQTLKANSQKIRNKKFQISFEPKILFDKIYINSFKKTVRMRLIKFYLSQKMIKQASQTLKQIVKLQKQKAQVFKEIINFIISLETSQKLQTFFNQNIPKNQQYFRLLHNYKLIRKKLQKQQSGYWKSFNYLKQSYVDLKQKNNILDNIFCKNKVIQILTSKELLIQPPLYLNLLCRFISFFNNAFVATLDQKYAVSLNFLQIIHAHFLTKEEIHVIIQTNNKFMPSQRIFSQKFYVVAKCIMVCLQIIDKNINKEDYNGMYMHLIKQMALLNFDLQIRYSYFLNRSLLNQQQFNKKISLCLQFFIQLNLLQENNLKRSNHSNDNQTQLKRQVYSKHANIINEEIRQLIYINKNFGLNLLEKQFFAQVLNVMILLINQHSQPINWEQKQQQTQDKIQSIWKISESYELNFNSEKTNTFNYITIMLLSMFFSKDKGKRSDQYEQNIQQKYQVYQKQFKKQNSQRISIITVRDIKFECQNIPLLKANIDKFDEMINCSEISQSIFVLQRLKLAFAYSDSHQIQSIFNLLLNQRWIHLKNFQLFTKIRLTALQLSTQKLSKQLLHNCFQWMNKLIKTFIKKVMQMQNQQTVWQYALDALIQLVNQYFTQKHKMLCQINIQFIGNSQYLCQQGLVSQFKQTINNLIDLYVKSHDSVYVKTKYNVYDQTKDYLCAKQKCQSLSTKAQDKVKILSMETQNKVKLTPYYHIRFPWVHLLISYYTIIEKSYLQSLRVFLFFSNIFNFQKQFNYNSFIILTGNLNYKSILFGKFEPRQYLQLYQYIGTDLYVKYTFILENQSLAFIFVALSYFQMQNQMFLILKKIADSLIKDYSCQRSTFFMSFIARIIVLNQSFLKQFQVKKKNLEHFFVQLIKKLPIIKKQISKYAYFSIVWFFIVKNQNYSLNYFQKRQMLLFIAQSMPFLHKQTKQSLLNKYYYLKQQINSQQLKKLQCISKHIRVTNFQYAKQIFERYYFINLNPKLKKLKYSSKIKVFKDKLLQKIHKLHEKNLQNSLLPERKFEPKFNQNYQILHNTIYKKQNNPFNKQDTQMFLNQINKVLEIIRSKTIKKKQLLIKQKDGQKYLPVQFSSQYKQNQEYFHYSMQQIHQLFLLKPKSESNSIDEINHL